MTLSWSTPALAAPEADENEPSPAASADGAERSRSRDRRAAGRDGSMKGRLGLGATRTVGGLNAILLRGYPGHRISLGWVTGVATFSHRDVDEDGEFGRIRTVGRVGFGPEVFGWLVQGDRDAQVHADVGLGLRMTAYVGFLGRLEDERGETLDIPVEIDFEVPVAVQLFIGPRVAILPEFGFVFRVIPGQREPDNNGDADSNPGMGAGSRLGTTDGPGFGFELGDHAGLFMGIGLAYFFGRV